MRILYEMLGKPWRPEDPISWYLFLLVLAIPWHCLVAEVDVSRDHYGDVFSPSKMDCNETICDQNGRQAALVPGRRCECQCAPNFSTFREDQEDCVRDINECPLAFFVRTFTTERIPMVFLPQTGQLVNPGAHLAISAAATAATGGTNRSSYLCGVNSTEIMSEDGWESMSHLETRHPLFAIYQDGRDNKSYLQWLGDDNIRAQLQNRLVLIYFQCKDSNRKGNDLVHLCVSVRVGWSPGVELAGTADKPRNNHYMIIGLCLGILGLVYVLALLVYLKIRQAKKLEREALAASLPISPESPPDNDECIATITNEFPAVLRGGIKTTTVSEERRSQRTRSKSKAPLVESPTAIRAKRNAAANGTTNGNNPSAGRFIEQRNGGYPGTQEIKVSRRNLYLHPELFEPDMLVSPPLPALEFLQRIREMIANARARLRNFRFRPTLVVIPEDDYFYQDSKDRVSARPGPRALMNRSTEVITEIESVPASSYSTKSKEYSSESIHGSGIGSVIVEYRVDTPPTPPKAYKPKQRRAPQPPVAKTPNEMPEELKDEDKPVAIIEPRSSGSGQDDTSATGNPLVLENVNKFDIFRRDLYNKLTSMYSDDRNGRKHSRSRGGNGLVVESMADSPYTNFDSVKRKSRANKAMMKESAKENHIYVTPETVIKTKQLARMENGQEQAEKPLVVELAEVVASERLVEQDEPEEVEMFVDDPPEKLFVTVDVEVIPDQVSEPPESAVEPEPPEASSVPRCQNKAVEPVVVDSTSSTPYDSLNSMTSRQARVASTIEKFRGDKKCRRERGAKNICLIRDGVLSTGTESEGESSCQCDKCSQVSSEDNSASSHGNEDHGEDPSLEEYLQLSDRVAQKLSERTVPYLGSSNQSSPEAVPKERATPLSQFVKDIRVTLNRIGGHFEMPKYSRSSSAVVAKAPSVEHNNWMLKKEDSVVGHGKKIIRKISMKNRKLANKIGRKFLHQNAKNDGFRENGESFDTVAEAVDQDLEEPSYEQYGSTGLSESSGDSKKTIVDPEQRDNESLANGRCGAFEADSLQRADKPMPAAEPVMSSLTSEDQVAAASDSELRAAYEGDSIESESIYAPATSDLTDDSLNVNREEGPSINDFSLEYESDMEPLEACLNLLANTPLEQVVGGRASKGLDITEHFKTAQWEHICHDKHSENGLPLVNGTNLRRRPTDNDVKAELELKAKNEANLERTEETEVGNGYHDNNGFILNGGGSCNKQFIRHKKNGKLSDALTRYKNGSSVRQRLSNNSGSDDDSVKSVQLDANSNYCNGSPNTNSVHDHVIHVDSGKNDFVTLIAVQTSTCSS